jgi:RimJ/RimL family protein N-acetyltransferase
MSEAVQLVVRFGFDTMQLKQIIAYTGPDNTASHGVLLKNGFVEKEMIADGDLKFVRLP